MKILWSALLHRATITNTITQQTNLQAVVNTLCSTSILVQAITAICIHKPCSSVSYENSIEAEQITLLLQAFCHDCLHHVT